MTVLESGLSAGFLYLRAGLVFVDLFAILLVYLVLGPPE
jgi:hypothetical protein